MTHYKREIRCTEVPGGVGTGGERRQEEEERERINGAEREREREREQCTMQSGRCNEYRTI